MTIRSLKETLSAQALINNPSANYYFEFDIVEFDHSLDAPDFLRLHFALKDNKNLYTSEVPEAEFRNTVRKWLFEYASSKNTDLDEKERTEKTDNFCHALQVFTKGKKIYHFRNVNQELYEYQLGIDFDYFYIDGKERNFLIYFSVHD